MKLKKGMAALAALAVVGAWATGACAAVPQPWELGFQSAASPVMDRIDGFHDMLLVIITLISVFVLGLMLYIIVRFRASRNPTPTRTAHNTLLEVVWTVIPILILVFIAIPSYKLLYYEDRTADPDMTLKVIGHQWLWEYVYPDQGGFSFYSVLQCRTHDECRELAEGGETPKRLLDVDNPVVLPVGANVQVLLTSGDVIHSWAMPSMGVKTDAIPGRLTETWLRVEEPGTYYGQCSELCGIDHGYMPIVIEAVPQAEFEDWVENAKKEFARNDGAPPVRVARSDAQ